MFVLFGQLRIGRKRFGYRFVCDLTGSLGDAFIQIDLAAFRDRDAETHRGTVLVIRRKNVIFIFLRKPRMVN